MAVKWDNLVCFEDFLNKAVENKTQTVRFLNGKEKIADFTISYNKEGKAILNFVCKELGDQVAVCKKHKDATNHVVFKPQDGFAVKIQKWGKKGRILARIYCKSPVEMISREEV